VGAGRRRKYCGDRGISGGDFGCPSDPVDWLQKPAQTEERREIVAALRTKLTTESVPDLTTSADLVDAAVGVLAGADFISGAQWARTTALSPSARVGSGPLRMDPKNASSTVDRWT
jgi:hypothetical protein